MPNPRKSLNNYSDKTKSKLSNKQKARASQTPVSVGTKIKVTDAPAEIKADPIAYKQFKIALSSVREYGYEYGEADLQMLCRLCFLYSEENRLRTVAGRETDTPTLLKVYSTLDGKRTKIIALEKELFLTPVSRMRALLAKPEKKELSEMEREFPEIF